MQIAKILVPLDTSALAERALPTAGALARAAGAELRLVLVHRPRPAAGYPDAPWNAARLGTERTYLNDKARELARSCGVPVSTQHPHGAPAETAIAAAAEWGADLVIIATHGRTGLQRAWGGSVADRVMRSLDIPVLMLREDVDAAAAHPAAPSAFQRILIPLDGSPRAERIIEAALAIGGESATYVLARVVAPVPLALPNPDGYTFTSAMPVDPWATDACAAEARLYLDRVAQTLIDRGAAIGERIVGVAPNPSTLLVDLARTERIDLIALASHGRDTARLVVGSVTDDLLRAGATPLLVCRRSAAPVPPIRALPLAHEIELAAS